MIKSIGHDGQGRHVIEGHEGKT